jgi:hypothetical protein
VEPDLIDDDDDEDDEDDDDMDDMSPTSWHGAAMIDPRSVDELVQFIESSSTGRNSARDTSTPSKAKRKKKNNKKKKKAAASANPTPAGTAPGSLPATGPTGGMNQFPKFWDEEMLADAAVQERVEAEIELFTQRLEQVHIRNSTAQLPKAQFEQIAKFSRENPRNIFRYLYQDTAADASTKTDRQR